MDRQYFGVLVWQIKPNFGKEKKKRERFQAVSTSPHRTVRTFGSGRPHPRVLVFRTRSIRIEVRDIFFVFLF